MDRATANRVGTEVSKAILEAGVSRASVAEAIDLDQSELDARLDGSVSFSVTQLVRIGGLLRVSAGRFLRSAA